jgi:DNA-binding NarL/FixJ family response regulator
MTLPPRLREVAIALAHGDNEKQIALRLALSRNTVHEYVRRLLERYGVSSRGELLVKIARQLHASAASGIECDVSSVYYQR